MRRAAGPLALVAIAASVVLAAGLLDAALAQGNPFGGPRPPAAPPAPPPDGVFGWLLAKQAEFYRELSGLVRQAKADGSAVWGLLAVSFAYGIFHAAGPGHGKAVISSYLVANDETWRRGIVLSFVSAMLQAVVAVALVGVIAAVLHASQQRQAMCGAAWYVEVISYALIALMGARLLWVKGRGFLAAWRAGVPRPVALSAAVTDANPAHGVAGHMHDESCDHTHGPTPDQLEGPGGWQRGLAAIFAVGLRPCSGAILVLVFSLAQGLFWAGVASTFAMGLGTAITVAALATLAVGAKAVAARLAGARNGAGSLTLRGIEVAAALLVLTFGLVLLAGYMVSERLVMVCP